MIRLGHVAAVLVLILVVPATASAEVVKHSDTLLDVDAEAGMILLAEMRPWDLDPETTVIIVRPIVVTPETEFALVRRTMEPSTGFPGDIVVEEAERWAIYPGDFVGVDCAHRGGRLIALRIFVADATVR